MLTEEVLFRSVAWSMRLRMIFAGRPLQNSATTLHSSLLSLQRWSNIVSTSSITFVRILYVVKVCVCVLNVLGPIARMYFCRYKLGGSYFLFLTSFLFLDNLCFCGGDTLIKHICLDQSRQGRLVCCTWYTTRYIAVQKVTQSLLLYRCLK